MKHVKSYAALTQLYVIPPRMTIFLDLKKVHICDISHQNLSPSQGYFPRARGPTLTASLPRPRLLEPG